MAYEHNPVFSDTFILVLEPDIVPVECVWAYACLILRISGVRPCVEITAYICGSFTLFFFVGLLLLFYIAFESVLIPMFIIIGVWGSRERKIRAAYFFFLYTLFGSVLLLLAIIYIFNRLFFIIFSSIY